MIRNKHHQQRNQGFIVIPLIIVVALLILSSTLYYSNYYTYRRIDNSRMTYHQNLTVLQQSVKALLMSPRAFIKSGKSALNPGFWDCLTNTNVSCTTVTPAAFNLMADDGDDTHLFIDATAAHGFSTELKPCATFPSLSCPFRYNLVWERECPTLMPCHVPGLVVSGTLQVSSQFLKVVPLKVDSYKLYYRVR